MKNEVKYTDAPMDVEQALDAQKRMTDFLPPPSELVEKIEKQKITISLNKRSVDFFKKAAKKEGVHYQTMLNNLLDNYVQHYG